MTAEWFVEICQCFQIMSAWEITALEEATKQGHDMISYAWHYPKGWCGDTAVHYVEYKADLSRMVQRNCVNGFERRLLRLPITSSHEATSPFDGNTVFSWTMA